CLERAVHDQVALDKSWQHHGQAEGQVFGRQRVEDVSRRQPLFVPIHGTERPPYLRRRRESPALLEKGGQVLLRGGRGGNDPINRLLGAAPRFVAEQELLGIGAFARCVQWRTLLD